MFIQIYMYFPRKIGRRENWEARNNLDFTVNYCEVQQKDAVTYYNVLLNSVLPSLKSQNK